MSEFIKPVRQTVYVKDELSELLGKSLIKDLHENEGICPICHGVGLRITDNPYGLSGDPNKKAGHFPYKHQSLVFCQNCYNGIVHYCPDCGKMLPRHRNTCDCEKANQRRQQAEDRKEEERLKAAEKHEPNALGNIFVMAQSDFFPSNEGYFSDWEDFFDSWNEERHEFSKRPLYAWGTEEIHMSFDAGDIVSQACEDMYEDAFDDIGQEAIDEMQSFLDVWKSKYGRNSYCLTYKHAIRIPWEEYEEGNKD